MAFFNIQFVAKYQKNEGGPLVQLGNQTFEIDTLKFGETRGERLRSALYLRLKNRKTIFLEKNLKFLNFFSFGECRIVPKNVKRGPFWIY